MILELGAALFHGLYGLRNILFELGPARGVKSALNLVLAAGGVGLFVFGAWAAWTAGAQARTLWAGGGATMTAPANVTFRIRRYDPAGQRTPAWEDITISYTHGMTVLDGLRVIKETSSATLAWRSSCRMGVCGSCGMFINGHPRLACNTQITELGTSLVTVAPLPNFAIIRDLVPDLRPLFEKHASPADLIRARAAAGPAWKGTRPREMGRHRRLCAVPGIEERNAVPRRGHRRADDVSKGSVCAHVRGIRIR